MKLVGLTGGMGSGKTTALNCFREKGVPCFVSDIEAKKLYDNIVFADKVKTLFKDCDITDADGKIDKKKLANIVFNDDYHLEKLNSLVHPELRKTFFDWAVNIAIKHPDVPYVIIESALIFQTELDKLLDDVIYVYLDKEERIKRCMLRDNAATREEIEARMNKQPVDYEAVAKADYLIFNFEGNPLWKQVKIIDRCLRKDTNNHRF